MAYDPDSRRAFVIDWQPHYHRLVYAEQDEGIRQYHPNGLTSTTHLSPQGLPTQIETHGQSSSFSLHYQYDAEDRVTHFEDSEFGQRAYEYDAKNQLLAVKSEPASSENFAYDGAGNRIRWNQETATFNALNQLIQQGTTHCQLA